MFYIYIKLPDQHHVHNSLRCHFYGTAYIMVLTPLISPGGEIDQITLPDGYTTQSVAAAVINGENSKFNYRFLILI